MSNIYLNSEYSISRAELNQLKTKPFYQNILSSLVEKYNIDSESIKWIDRVLEYYIYPQNYNDLSYSSLYRDFILHVNGGSLRTPLNIFCEKKILKKIVFNNNTYFLFEKEIEILINRYIVFESLGI